MIVDGLKRLQLGAHGHTHAHCTHLHAQFARTPPATSSYRSTLRVRAPR
jgi:hypothetical protein